MINYSTFMMGNPADANAAPKAYEKPQITEIIPFGKFVKHFADHNCVFTPREDFRSFRSRATFNSVSSA